MSDEGTKEHKNWMVTFAIAMLLFGVLYLGTLLYGNSLVEHHEAPTAAGGAH